MEKRSVSSTLLSILEQRRDSFTSGEMLSSELGVSRTAVWKAVNRLRSEGHIIEAVTHRGYRLADESDVFSREGIISCLSDIAASSLRIDYFSRTGSTNNVCLSKASDGEGEGYVAVSGMQTGGKGRRGRSFYSPQGTGVYLSILLRPDGCTPEAALRFTTMAAVAVCEAIEYVSGKDAYIKWVNDIIMDGHKVCGILTEASFSMESGMLDYAVVGIGINVFTPEGGFPGEISDVAGAVFGEGENSTNARNRLAAEVLSRFMKYYGEVSADASGHAGYIGEYRQRCCVIGKKIKVIKAGADPVSAVAKGLDDELGLIVEYEDGSTETLSSGEISIRL